MLQNKFNTIYEEWKDYKEFFLAELERQNENMKQTMSEVVKDLDNDEKLLQFFYDTRMYPKMYEADFNLLSLKLVTAYNLVKEDVDISEPQQKEIDDLLKGYKTTQRFVIKAGAPDPVNPDLIEKTKEQFKKSVEEKELLKPLQSLKDQDGG